jgi:hypothetical protein
LAEDVLGKLKLSINLEDSQFNKGIQQVKRELTTSQQAFKIASNSVGSFENKTEGLKVKAEALSSVMKNQQTVAAKLKTQFDAVAKEQGENSAAAQRLQTQFLASVAAYKKTESQLAATTREMKDLGDQSKKTKDEMNTGGGTASKFGGMLKGAFLGIAGVAVGAVAGVAAFGGSIVNASADIAALNSQYSQVMGKMKGDTDKYLNEMGKKWNKHPNELKGAYTQYVAILKSKGLSEKEAHATAKQYLDRTVDANAFANEDMNDTVARFMGGIKGKHLPLTLEIA